MKIQLLNSSKFKITFNKIDLDENNISVHNFLSNGLNSQKFIKAIIEIAFEDFGFKMENNDFVYEIYCFDFSEFIIIVYNNIDVDNVSYISQNFSFKFNNNKLLKNENLFFFFNKFEDFLNFSEYIKNSLKFKNISSFLYKHNDIFLLEIITSNLQSTELAIFQTILLETKNSYLPCNLTVIRFKEFAEVLFSENALNL